jgi:phage regulator Rha-like protein
MSKIVFIRESEPKTTSLKIASGTQNPHATVIKLVRKYRDDLSEFGFVGFEIQPRAIGKHGGSDTEYAVLNEQQTTLLFTYMRNTPVMREFKKALVREFFAMREELQNGGPRKLTAVRSGPEIRITFDGARLAKQAAAGEKASLRLLNHLTGVEVADLIEEIEAKDLKTKNGQMGFFEASA